MKTLYQYTIRTDGEKTELIERGRKFPISCAYTWSEKGSLVSAGFLRDLAKWAIEQAEEIERGEGYTTPTRKPFVEYMAVLQEVQP